MDKQIVVYSYHGTLLIKKKKKKEWSVDIQNKMDASLTHYAEQNKTDTKENMLHDSWYIKFKNK